MSTTIRAPPLFLPSITLFLLLLASSSHANTIVCNPNSYGDNDPFGPNREDLLQELVVWLTPWAAGHEVYSVRPLTGTPLVYGHAVCRPGLVGDDCQHCLGYAATQMEQICGRSLGGRAAQGDDCRVRYEQYAFTD
ncbi:hypothetical protein HU200_042115 [Digitaria exilis]|uniref:Gnk2-homologous domain-containing protein n=1 Tax=Digitaria exilis TaxID=1010633 RepID=A0A835BH47_9POAL|nr:hypothetical protein HU200_042115 [Digitaria exilis]